jgi:hypothetical protein
VQESPELPALATVYCTWPDENPLNDIPIMLYGSFEKTGPSRVGNSERALEQVIVAPGAGKVQL